MRCVIKATFLSQATRVMTPATANLNTATPWSGGQQGTNSDSTHGGVYCKQCQSLPSSRVPSTSCSDQPGIASVLVPALPLTRFIWTQNPELAILTVANFTSYVILPSYNSLTLGVRSAQCNPALLSEGQVSNLFEWGFPRNTPRKCQPSRVTTPRRMTQSRDATEVTA